MNDGSSKVEAKGTKARERLRQMWEKARLSDERLEDLRRLQAEFDNYRKRIARERNEFFQHATEDLICELLPVVDNFERAIHEAGKNSSPEGILQGVKIIYKELWSILKKRGLEKITAKGESFNPAQHEAIEHVETAEYPDNTVIEEVVRGYRIKGRVLRPAMVRVSKKVEEKMRAKNSQIPKI